MSVDLEIKQQQLRAVVHGSIAILIGLFAGIALTYSALGEIPLWPLLSTKITMPGTVALWRGAHTGPIMNGVMCIALVSCFNLVRADLISARRITNCLVWMVWGNTIFYVARIWGTNQGLALHSEKFGQGNAFDGLAMVPAVLVMFVTIYAVAVLLRLALKERSALS